MADTSQAGYLVPFSTPPLYDDDLLDALQPIIAGIGNYPDSSLVRPRWQTADSPLMPDYDTNWLGFGVSDLRADTYQYQAHVAQGVGFDVYEYTEEIDLLISCYGPKSQAFNRLLRDGFHLDQNRVPLQALGMDVMFVGKAVTLPALLHGQWVRRVDFTITFRRYLSSSYGVLTLVGLANAPSQNGINNEQYITPIIVGP